MENTSVVDCFTILSNTIKSSTLAGISKDYVSFSSDGGLTGSLYTVAGSLTLPCILLQ